MVSTSILRIACSALVALVLLSARASADTLPEDARLAFESTLAWLLHERGADLSPELQAQINANRFLRFEGGIDPRRLRPTAENGLWLDIDPANPQTLHLDAPHNADIELLSGSFGVINGQFAAANAEFTWKGQLYRSQGLRWQRVFRGLALHFEFSAEMIARLGMTPDKQAELQALLVASYTSGGDYIRVLRDFLTGQAGAEKFQQNDMSILQTFMCRLENDTCAVANLIGFVGAPF